MAKTSLYRKLKSLVWLVWYGSLHTCSLSVMPQSSVVCLGKDGIAENDGSISSCVDVFH